MSSSKSVTLFVLISLFYILLSFYVYRDVSGHGFLHWDDMTYVTGNKHVQELNLDNMWWMLTKHHANNWHPLSWLSHSIDVALWGNNPARHHQTNIFIHSLNAICMFFLTLTLIQTATNNNSGQLSRPDGNNILAAFVAGLLFLIHPQHVESVAWIAERKDVLCALFYMLSILAYIHYTVTGKSSLKTISILLYIFSLMSKSMAVSLPLVLLLLDYYPLKRSGNHNSMKTTFVERIREKSIYLLAAMVTAFIAIITQYTSGAVRTLDEISIFTRLANAANSLIFYIYKFLIPINYSAYYPYPEWILDGSLTGLIPVLLIIIIFTLLIKADRNGRRLGLTSLGFYLVTIFPVIGIMQVGTQAAADRYTYIPLMVFYILAGLLVQKLHARLKGVFPKALLYSLFAAVVYFLIITTQGQIPVWKDDKTLWKSVISRYPDTVSVAHANLGSVYFEEGSFSFAESEYKKALTINPGNINYLLNLGLTLEKLNKNNEAISLYRKIASINPGSFWIFAETGNAFFRLLQYKEALLQYINALRANPGSEEVIIQIARIRALTGEYKVAHTILAQLLARHPDNIDAIVLTADIFNLLKNDDQASQYYAKALKLDPKNKHVIHELNTIRMRK